MINTISENNAVDEVKEEENLDDVVNEGLETELLRLANDGGNVSLLFTFNWYFAMCKEFMLAPSKREIKEILRVLRASNDAFYHNLHAQFLETVHHAEEDVPDDVPDLVSVSSSPSTTSSDDDFNDDDLQITRSNYVDKE